MKRGLSLLLLLTMLFCAAAGHAEEGAHIVVTFGANAETLRPVIEAAGISEEDSAMLAEALQGLCGDMKAELWTEGGTGWAAALSLKDERLAYVRGGLDGQNNLLIESSLMPGYTIAEPIEGLDEFSDSLGLAAKNLAGVNWEELSKALEDGVKAWQEGNNWEASSGTFYGDAYEAASYRESITLSERDLAVLGLLLAEKAAPFLGSVDTDGSLIREMRAELLKAGAANRYRYLVHRVYDRKYEPMGLSVTVLTGSEQVATFSLGKTGDGAYRLVAGVGFEDDVYYAAADLSGSLTWEYWTGKCVLRFYNDPDRVGFPGAAEEAEHLRGTLEIECSGAFDAAGSLTLDSSAALTVPGRDRILEKGSLRVDTQTGLLTADDSVYIADAGEPALTVRLAADGDMSGLPAWQEGTKRLTVEEMNSDHGFTDAISQSVRSLGIRLIRLLPAELILFLMQ